MLLRLVLYFCRFSGQIMVWFVVSIYLLASMLQKHLMSPPRPSVHLGAAIVRAVWSSKMCLADAPAILNLLDGPVGC